MNTLHTFLGQLSLRERDASKSLNEVEKREGSSSQIDRFCNGDIPLDYALQAFTDADFVFISHDIRANGKRGSIRGFMCVRNNHNARGDHEEGTLYIDLICNSTFNSILNLSITSVLFNPPEM